MCFSAQRVARTADMRSYEELQLGSSAAQQLRKPKDRETEEK